MLREIGRAREPFGRLAGGHAHGPDAALRGRRHGIEPEQGAGRHDDLTAVFLRQGNEIGARQQRAGAQHHDGLAGFEHRSADPFEQGCGGALDCQVGQARECLQFDQRASDTLGIEPGLRLGPVAARHTGEHEPRYAVGEPAGNDTPDGAQAGYGDTGH